MIMWLKAYCELVFDAQIPTPFLLMLRPRSGRSQWIASESYMLSPAVPVVEFTDIYGNLCQRLTSPSGRFEIQTESIAMTSGNIDVDFDAPFVEIQNLPDSVLTFLLPSRYCESDRFGDLAAEIVADRSPGYDQVSGICDWIASRVIYAPGSSNVPVSAMETKNRGRGVCRDLAHLGISLCRSLSIPARLVVGYLYGLVPMDIHAWFEAYVGGRWYTFDPTQAGPKGGRIAVAYGKDAADVAVFTQFGPALIPVSMVVGVEKPNGPPAPRQSREPQ